MITRDDVTHLLRALADGPASALRAVDLAAGVARARLVLRGAEILGRPYVGGRLVVDLRGDLTVGHGVFFFGGPIPSAIVCRPGARVILGEDTQLNYGVSLEAACAVRIGRRCRIGSLVHIADASRDRVAEIVVGDDVWIAHGAILEPGARVGNGSAVSAGSVVTGEIPPGCLAIGNPARAVQLATVSGASNQGVQLPP